MKSAVLFSFFDFGVRLYTTAQIAWFKLMTNFVIPFKTSASDFINLYVIPVKKRIPHYTGNTFSIVNHGEIFMCFEEETIKNTDFCLVKQRTHPGNSSNMIVLRNKNNFKKYLLDAESTYQECAFKFISMEIVIDNKRLHVPLFLQDNYNYFMVDNEVDKDFMLYFIKTHLLSEYQDIFGDTSFHNIINGEFQFDIIDHNCESKCIDGQATIKFFKEAYEIE